MAIDISSPWQMEILQISLFRQPATYLANLSTMPFFSLFPLFILHRAFSRTVHHLIDQYSCTQIRDCWLIQKLQLHADAIFFRSDWQLGMGNNKDHTWMNWLEMDGNRYCNFKMWPDRQFRRDLKVARLQAEPISREQFRMQSEIPRCKNIDMKMRKMKLISFLSFSPLFRLDQRTFAFGWNLKYCNM